MYLALDIGGTAVKIGLVDRNGSILKKESYSVSFDNYETAIFSTVKKSIEKFIEKNEIKILKLRGIGVSATGQIDSNLGKVIGVGGNIKNWCGIEIKKELESIYGVNTTVINDANAMIIGESWVGKGKGFNNIIGITIGTGIGGGIIVDSKILLGSFGIAGEIGHFSIDRNGEKCSCGNIGCYEKYGSTTALIREVKRNYHNLEALDFNIEDINGEVIFKEIKKGNKKLENIVDRWIFNIAIGMVNLIHIFNPEIILIGGGVSSQEELFIEKLRRIVIEKTMPRFKEKLEIQSAKLGNDAGIIGAVYYNIINS